MRVSCCLAVLALHFTSLLCADQVLLHNGDRLTGTIDSLSKGKLAITTAYAGKIEIEWGQISSLTMEEKRQIEFADGFEEIGTISPSRPGVVKIVTQSGKQSDTQLALIEAISAAPSADAPKSGLLSNWKGTADLGITVTRGNIDSDNYSLHFNPERHTDKDRIDLTYTAVYGVQEEASLNVIQSGILNYDRLVNPNLFYFGVFGLDHNRQQDLDLRTRAGGGLGYKTSFWSDSLVSFRGGVAFVRENFIDSEDLNEPQGLVTFELESPFLGGTLDTTFEYHPRLNENRFLLHWRAKIDFPIYRNLTLGLRFYDFFDSEPPEDGVVRNDVGLVSTIGWKF